MADALKTRFDATMIRRIAAELRGVHLAFDERRFVRDALDGLDAHELMARGAHVAEVMRRHLPTPYEEAIAVVIQSLVGEPATGDVDGFSAFRYLPHSVFIARYGLDHFEASMRAQHALTRRFTAEFSIRPFLERHPDATLARLREWARDPNVHVRRLVSEGTRPRLPWAMRLRAFQRDPAPVLELLELLKDDPERYVQRSVANSLNDIAKDHPDIVVATCRRWLADRDATDGRRWIVSHALRSLVKQGDHAALSLLGAGDRPRVDVESVTLAPKRVPIGGKLQFTLTLRSTARREQSLVVDYAVHFVKRNGARAAKVFKLRRVVLAGRGTVTLTGRVSFAPMTTRTPYPGRHLLEARVNGVAFPLGEFVVTAPTP